MQCTTHAPLRDATRHAQQMVNLELPDLTMGVSDGKGEMFTVSGGGEVLWSRQASFTIACKMNLERLPFDTQPCGLLAGLYSQRAEQVQLVWRDPAKYEALANWGGTCLAGWVATSLVQNNELQSFTTGNFTYARATIALTRVPHSMMLNFITSVIMVFISCLGFLIDPANAPARVTLGVVRQSTHWFIWNAGVGVRSSLTLSRMVSPLARVTRQVTLLVVLQNYISLSSNTPRDVSASWLGRFTLVSFLFNIAIFAEQILVNFGLQAQQWLDEQRAYVASVQKWDRVLYQQRHRLYDLFQEWDTNGDGHISKKQFLRGIKKLAPATPIAEARSRRPTSRALHKLDR